MNAKVRATYLEKELVRVEFAHSHLVSDHPVAVGGNGKGPSPGELLAAAYASASVFAARERLDAEGVAASSVSVRVAFRGDRVGAEGPLGPLAYLGLISRRIEIAGEAPKGDPLRFGNGLGLLETLGEGVDLVEDVNIARTASAGRQDLGWRNEHFHESEAALKSLAPGATVSVVPSAWRMVATEVAPGLALLDLAGAPLLVSVDARMATPTPHDLLLGGLAACTAIFVARNARNQNMTLERVTVEVGAERPTRLAEPVRRMTKTTWMAGPLTGEEAERCKFFADYCAIGETLKRGAQLTHQVVFTGATGGHAALGSLPSRADKVPPPADCDDGACCVAPDQARHAVEAV